MVTHLVLGCDPLLFVLFLFLQKIDVNKNLSGGRCPLHYAADMGQTDVIKYLIAQGADVDVGFFELSHRIYSH